MSDPRLLEADHLPLDVLLRLARREVEDDDADAPTPFLVALHGRPVREVFDRAAALVNDGDATRRALGVRILRELGEERSDGHRPFGAETIPLLRARLREEADPAVLRWLVSALGYHRAHEALPDVLAFADHPDDRVRFHVAAGLPSLVDPAGVEPEAAHALIRLCRDADADIRYYALYAATREIAGLSVRAMIDLTAQLLNDPDDQVRSLAAEYRTDVADTDGTA